MARTHAVGRGWWGRPWCTQRWALPGSGYNRHNEDFIETLAFVCLWKNKKQNKTNIQILVMLFKGNKQIKLNGQGFLSMKEILFNLSYNVKLN